MSSSYAGWWSAAMTALAFAVLTGCDVPTGSPSINTETDLNTPLVKEKTFTFLGGPKSDAEPLIDTTSSQFDSLFTVDSESDISIVQEIDDFDIGSLEGALDSAAADLSVSNTFSETLIGNGDLITQDVSTDFEEQNDTFTNASDPGARNVPVIADRDGDNEIVVDFPAPGVSTDDVLPAPQFGAVDASGATVLSVTPTDANSDIDGPLNQITFTLTNNGSNDLTCDDSSTEITCSSGDAPVIVVEGAEGASSDQQSFGTGRLGPGASETATVDVSSLTLGEDAQGNTAQYRLFVKGTDDQGNTAELDIDLTRFEYQEATVDDPQNVEISASTSGLGVVGGNSNFEALTGGGGSLNLTVERSNSGLGDFDTNIGNATIKNVDIPGFAPSSFSDTFIDGSPGGNSVDVAGRDLAKTIDINDITASPEPGDPLTFSADDVYTISINGTVDIATLYFRPDGETVRTEGTVSIQSNQVDIQSGDLVEVSNAVITTDELDLQPDISFDTLTFNYPDLRRGPDFQPEDSLQVRFVRNPDPNDPFEFDSDRLQGEGFDVTLDENLQIRPQKNNTVQFRLSGKLVDADDASVTGSDAEGIARAGDGVVATTSVRDFGIQKIDVSESNAFTVNITTDENGDGQLDLANDAESETASFDGFEGISSQVDDLELADTKLDFSVTTTNLTRTKAQLYAAIQGKNETESIFLAGEQGPDFDRSVSSNDLAPFETEIVNGSTSPVPEGNLIGFEVDRENASLGESVSGPSTSNSAPLPINDDNSNVSDFVNTLPTEIRLAGQAEMNAEGGALRLQDPIELDAGFTLDVPLRVRDRFVLRDTIEEDLSDLDDLTDPEEDVNVSTAEIQFSYTNGLPLGANVKLTVVDGAGEEIETFNENFDDDDLRIEPAPKNSDGTASGTASGEFVFTLGETREDLRALADGKEIQLELQMDQEGAEQGGAVARFRADDPFTLDQVRLRAKATVQAGN